jgi:hypothetical protein
VCSQTGFGWVCKGSASELQAAIMLMTQFKTNNWPSRRRLGARLGAGLVASLLFSVALAQNPPEVVITADATAAAPIDQGSCRDVSVEEARKRADEAFRNKDYRRAGECYLVIGDNVKANRAFAKAAAADGATAATRFALAVDQAKGQFRRVQEAFGGH